MFENFWSDKSLNYAALAIPAFFLFLGLEYMTALHKNRRNLFKFDSSITNISIGIAERLLNLFLTAFFYGVFNYVYEHFAIWSIPNHWIVWILLLLITDLIWYWYHRLGHEINLFWAAHIVHHHSEEFNYSVSARITTLQAIVRNAFWIVLPLAGFHPTLVMSILIIHGTYSFFTHTQVIGKLGWLEYILITPSHHGVHHSSNEKYLNKNYGDLFVFWDKLFGTFQKEEERPVYGLTHPLKSHSFLWQHFHYFFELYYATSRVEGIVNKLKIIFGKPEVLDQNIRTEIEKKFFPHRVQGNTVIRFNVYLVVQIVVVITVLFAIALFYNSVEALEKIVGSLFIMITLINCGAMLEQRKWIYYLEYIRLFLITSYLSFWIESPQAFFLSTVLIIILGASNTPRKFYLKFVYDI
ncbi:MAG: sterol desaturase family protein [Chryseolinea sp.]